LPTVSIVNDVQGINFVYRVPRSASVCGFIDYQFGAAYRHTTASIRQPVSYYSFLISLSVGGPVDPITQCRVRNLLKSRWLYYSQQISSRDDAKRNVKAAFL